jgi:5'-nucleotidase
LGIRVGVIGTIAPGAFDFYDAAIRSGVRVSDQEMEIRADLASLREKHPDIIVLLSHSGFDRDRELADRFPGVDVIIGGHSQHLIDTPCVRGKTIIVQAGMNGAHIGILELTREAGRTVKCSNSFLQPDDKTPGDDRGIRALITRYQQETRRKYKNVRFD